MNYRSQTLLILLASLVCVYFSALFLEAQVFSRERRLENGSVKSNQHVQPARGTHDCHSNPSYFSTDTYVCSLTNVVLVKKSSTCPSNLCFLQDATNEEMVLPRITQQKFGPQPAVVYVRSTTMMPRCKELINSTAIHIQLDGWNPFHQLLLSFGPLMSTIHKLFGEDIRALDWVPLIDEKPRETPNEVLPGPFGSGVLSLLSQHSAIQIKSLKRPTCFNRIILGGGMIPSWPFPNGDTSGNRHKGLTTDAGLKMLGLYLLSRCDVVEPLFTPSGGDPWSIVYIRRSGRRKLVDEDQLLRVLRTIGENYGLRVVDLNIEEGSSSYRANLCRVARILRSAALLVGNHGAGLANMIFLPPDSAIVEITHEDRVDYWNMHRLLGRNSSMYFTLASASSTNCSESLDCDLYLKDSARKVRAVLSTAAQSQSRTARHESNRDYTFQRMRPNTS